MRATRVMTGSIRAPALCLIVALFTASAVHAQSRTSATAADHPATQVQPDASTDAMFARWDKDKSKSLSLDEFRAGWQEIRMNLALRRLHANFVAMDANKDGSLDAGEYANLPLIKKAGASAPPMSTFDTDKNQKLDFKEYVGMIGAMLKKKR